MWVYIYVPACIYIRIMCAHRHKITIDEGVLALYLILLDHICTHIYSPRVEMDIFNSTNIIGFININSL